ncbi:pyridoxal phosphate-dependent aminotransferase [Flaviramulus aquimarinus]
MIKINKHISQLKPSATLAINQNVKKLREDGETVFHFGFGQSPFPIHKSIVGALKENVKQSHYLSTTGLYDLRVQIAGFLKKHQDVDANWEHVFIGPGSKELLYQTILIFEGTFLIPKGSWVSYLPQIHSKDGKHAILETDLKHNFKLIPEVLETYCKQHSNEQNILILNSPNNPTGAVYSNQELQAIAKVCKAYNIIVMSDEIYSQVNFKKDFSPSISKYYPEKTIVFGGLSKVFSAGGYRLGFMYLPKDLQQLDNVYRSLFSETFSAVATPIQYAAIKAYKMKPKLKKHIKKSNSVLKAISSYVYSELAAVNIQCTTPQGAFYMMIGFNGFKKQINALGIFTSISLAKHLLNKYCVALLPGSDFYFKEEDLFFRLAFVDFNGKKALNGIEKKGNIEDTFVQNYCPNVYNGIEKLKLFVKSL